MSIDILNHIKRHVTAETIQLTLHAQQEMINDAVGTDELIEALQNCQIIENYPDHRRGPCCLVCSRTSKDRFLHIVCTTQQPELIIITVYEPAAPKWKTPYKRG